MGWGGALVGCGSCSSRGVTATVQMRSAGSVRFMWASMLRVACERAFLFLARHDASGEENLSESVE